MRPNGRQSAAAAHAEFEQKLQDKGVTESTIEKLILHFDARFKDFAGGARPSPSAPQVLAALVER